MAHIDQSLDERLECIRAAQQNLLLVALQQESRTDILRQELQQLATEVQRLSLAQANAKTAAQKHSDILAELVGKLSDLLARAESVTTPPQSSAPQADSAV